MIQQCATQANGQQYPNTRCQLEQHYTDMVPHLNGGVRQPSTKLSFDAFFKRKISQAYMVPKCISSSVPSTDLFEPSLPKATTSSKLSQAFFFGGWPKSAFFFFGGWHKFCAFSAGDSHPPKKQAMLVRNSAQRPTD